MKHRNLHKWVNAGILFLIISAVSIKVYSQSGNRSRRLHDGTVVYSDGTIKRTDGTLKYPDGRIRQSDGSIKYPDGTVRYPGNNNANKPTLPPGQAKKLFDTKSAKPFAPGQQKKLVTGNKGNGKGRK
jgi:hypothetical protein